MEAPPLELGEPTRILYNDIDPFCCEWLRRLMAEDLIPHGDVLCKSITEITPDELEPYHSFHAFAGLGGWAYALRLAGWPDDEPVDTVSCPCQPWSFAGLRNGHSDERHLWPAYRSLRTKHSAPVVLGEQVAHAVGLGWLDGVAGDLEGDGYAVGASILQACAVGAPHKRDRLWFVAHSERDQQPRKESRRRSPGRVGWEQQLSPWDGGWAAALARFRTVDDGLPRCVEATDAARNAIVPQVAAAFIEAAVGAMQDMEGAR